MRAHVDSFKNERSYAIVVLSRKSWPRVTYESVKFDEMGQKRNTVIACQGRKRDPPPSHPVLATQKAVSNDERYLISQSTTADRHTPITPNPCDRNKVLMIDVVLLGADNRYGFG